MLVSRGLNDLRIPSAAVFRIDVVDGNCGNVHFCRLPPQEQCGVVTRLGRVRMLYQMPEAGAARRCLHKHGPRLASNDPATARAPLEEQTLTDRECSTESVCAWADLHNFAAADLP